MAVSKDKCTLQDAALRIGWTPAKLARALQEDAQRPPKERIYKFADPVFVESKWDYRIVGTRLAAWLRGELIEEVDTDKIADDIKRNVLAQIAQGFSGLAV